MSGLRDRGARVAVCDCEVLCWPLVLSAVTRPVGLVITQTVTLNSRECAVCALRPSLQSYMY